MINGTVRNPKKGQKYKIYLSNGEFMLVIYRGLGPWFNPQWEVLESGEILTGLAPMAGYEELSD